MTPYEYALRSHPEQELPFHTVWLYGWSNDAAFQVTQVLGWKELYQRCISFMGKSRQINDEGWWQVWNRDANRYGLKYLEKLKELEGMK